MCAINGITTEDVLLVERMNRATLHRGPDGSRTWRGRGVTLGHNRLAIIDLSDAAQQPMFTPDQRYAIVFNGEIYNYRELRAELALHHTFKTQSDTEVLLAAYAQWGEAMFKRLRGIFAFAIWDAETSSLLLVRDQMGVKPLYYRHGQGVLSFSSELPALMTEAGGTLDARSLAFYLSMEYVPAPRTLVAGINKLPAGHLLRFASGKLEICSYLEPVPVKRAVTHRELYSTIDQAVHRQLVSDRPVGAYLSGGFDSSIVVHHMTKHAPLTRTYSVDFEAVAGEESEAGKFNADAALARQTAKFYGTEHKTLTVSLTAIRSTIETAARSVSEPIANSTAITQYLLSDFVRKDGTVVVLGGDGGDELFGGYTRHRIAMVAYLYQKFPAFMQRLGGSVSARVGKLATPFGTPLHLALMVKSEKKIAPFLQTALTIDEPTKSFFDAEYERERGHFTHPLDTFMQVDRRTWLPDECFLRSDYASMAHGVELRVPLVDLDVVTLADQISVFKKTWPHEGKRILRQAYKQYLPPHLYGQPKRGWLSPAAKWFRDPVIGDLARNVFSSAYYDGLDGLFDWDSVQKLLTEHNAKGGYHLYPLWNILVLQIWAREQGVTFMDR